MLFVSYHFPPTTEVGAKRIVRFCRYLPEFGIEPVVLTIDPRFYELTDNSFGFPESLRVIRTELDSTLLSRYRARTKKQRQDQGTKTASTGSTTEPNKRRGALRRHVLAGLGLTDLLYRWRRRAMQVVAELVEKERFDAVFSSGPPFSTHLIARDIRRQYGIPWISDYRDAWTCDPWRSFDELPRWREWVDRRLQRECMEVSDLVLSVTEEMRATFLKRYHDLPESKFVTLTNGFDDAEGNDLPAESRNDQAFFVHLGTLYGDRKIDNFCRALSDLASSGKLDRKSFKVLFVGDIDPEFVSQARSVAPHMVESGSIEFRGWVSWQEGQQLLRQATALLVIQGHHAEAIPAKVFEYMRVGKPIFAIVNSGSLGNMLDRTGLGYWADPDDVSAIASQLKKTLSMANTPLDEMRERAMPYHFRRLSELLASLLRDRLPAARAKGKAG